MEQLRVLLFSGGLDSTALAWKLRPEVCLTIDYGQRPARGEIAAASSLAEEMGLRHEIVRVDLATLGSGQLAGRAPSGLAVAPEWWPFRNQMLITLAGMRFAVEGATEIIIGAISSDVHADGRAPFLRAIDRAMRLQEGCIRVSAPARGMSAHKLLIESGLPFELLGATFSCHLMEYPCGQCRGCEKHRETLERMKS